MNYSRMPGCYRKARSYSCWSHSGPTGKCQSIYGYAARCAEYAIQIAATTVDSHAHRTENVNLAGTATPAATPAAHHVAHQETEAPGSAIFIIKKVVGQQIIQLRREKQRNSVLTAVLINTLLNLTIERMTMKISKHSL
jgi:hypothetical protein